ncbi:MAG: IPT/TIG domain-containing protein [Oligoflexia bacterium]|nr:IPT/TIG domain-containing protein [Oligoflexia bacterium]
MLKLKVEIPADMWLRIISRFLIPLALTGALVLSGCTKAKLNNARKSSMVAAVQALSKLKIFSLIPTRGPTEGGTILTLQGEGFFQGLDVLIGGQPCANVQVHSSTRLTCTSPAHAEALVDLVLSVPKGNPLVLAGVYNYVRPLNPATGFAITSGGGVSTGTGMVMQSSIGEVSIPAISTGAGVTLVSGVQAATP